MFKWTLLITLLLSCATGQATQPDGAIDGLTGQDALAATTCTPASEDPSSCCRFLPDTDAVSACEAFGPNTCGVAVCRQADCSFTKINVCGPTLDAGTTPQQIAAPYPSDPISP